jgi:hypothetical protein
MNTCELYLAAPQDFTRIYSLFIRDTHVSIYAHDDRERFEFRINGAVCAYLAYDAIRYDQSEPNFHEERYLLMLERAYHARARYRFYVGPIFV